MHLLEWLSSVGENEKKWESSYIAYEIKVVYPIFEAVGKLL